MQRICVYCGSQKGRNSAYEQLATQLASTLVQANIGLVYGGASVGIMGIMADEVLKRGGQVTGVIPEVLMAKEVAHRELTELHVVKSMHERKAMMAQLADGFISLPGGLGTLEELFETLTWSVLGIHKKPCGLLNCDGYYDSLMTFLQHATDEHFIKPEHHKLLICDNQPGSLLRKMQQFVAIGATPGLSNDES